MIFQAKSILEIQDRVIGQIDHVYRRRQSENEVYHHHHRPILILPSRHTSPPLSKAEVQIT